MRLVHWSWRVAVGVVVLGTPAVAEEKAPSRPCLSEVDQQNLAALTACFYQPGEPLLQPGPAELLASSSAEALSAVQQPQAEPATVVAAKVVGSEQLGERTVARVSVRLQQGGCEVTSTESWVQEDSRWRRIWYPPLRLLAHQLDADFQSPDVVATHNRWLDADPYALAPMTSLVELLAEGPDLVEAELLPALPTSPHGDVKQLVARALKTNPEDDAAMALGIRHAPTLKAARALFAQVPKNRCARPNLAALLIEHFDNPRQLRTFVESEKSESPVVVSATVQQLITLEAAAELKAYLTAERAALLRQRWENDGKERAASQAAFVAVALSKLKDKKEAASWRSYALEVAPGRKATQAILDAAE